MFFKRILTICLSLSCLHAETISMQKAIEKMKQHNVDVRISHEKQLLNQKAQSQHDNRFMPSLSPIELQYETSDQKASVKSSAAWNTPLGGQFQINYQQSFNDDPSVNVSFEQPITHNIGFAEDKIKAIDIEITQLNQTKQYQDLILKMRRLYLQCVIEKQLLEQQQHKIDDIRQAIQHQRILFQGGEISKIELDKLLLQYERTSIDFVKKEQSFELNLIELKKMLGIDPNKDIVLDSTISFQKANFSPLPTLQLAMHNNLDYLISKLNFQKAKYLYEISNTKSLPQVSVYANANEKKKVNAGIKIKLQLPSNESDYQETKTLLDYQHATENFQKAQSTLRTNVHKLLIDIENQNKLISLAARNLQLQQSLYQAESIKFKHQQISLEDFQKASDQLQDAYQTSLQAQVDYSNKYDELLLLIGDFNHIIQPERHHE